MWNIFKNFLSLFFGTNREEDFVIGNFKRTLEVYKKQIVWNMGKGGESDKISPTDKFEVSESGESKSKSVGVS